MLGEKMPNEMSCTSHQSSILSLPLSIDQSSILSLPLSIDQSSILSLPLSLLINI